MATAATDVVEPARRRAAPVEKAPYSYEALDRLIEGGYFLLDGERWMEASPTWLDIRALVETTGHLEATVVSELLDLERAFNALAKDYPIGAFVVSAVAMGMEPNDINHVLGRNLRMHPAKILDKSTAYLRAYMNGRDPRAAWRRGRRSVR